MKNYTLLQERADWEVTCCHYPCRFYTYRHPCNIYKHRYLCKRCKPYSSKPHPSSCAHKHITTQEKKSANDILFIFKFICYPNKVFTRCKFTKKMLIYKNSAGTNHVPCATAKRKDRHIALQHLCTKHIRQKENKKYFSQFSCTIPK